MKINLLPIKVFLTINLVIGGILQNNINLSAAQSESLQTNKTSEPSASQNQVPEESENGSQNDENFPEPPLTGTPEGVTTPGGTRQFSGCPSKKKPLTALIANNGRDFTLLKYPSFWIYVPYTAAEINYMEFALKDPQEFKTVYRSAIKLKDEPGTIEISIPNDPKYALEKEKDYSWDLLLYCNRNSIEEPDLTLKGWVRRVDRKISPENIKSEDREYFGYLKQNIWYDAIASLAKQHFATRENLQTSAAWTELLRKIGKEEVAREPFAESIALPPVE